MLEILNETVEYYKTNQRGLNFNVYGHSIGCLYYNEQTGGMCAVGRCLTNPESLDSNCFIRYINDLDQYLKEEYRGHSVHFWALIQALHDDGIFWEKNNLGGSNLTNRGLSEVEYIRNLINGNNI